MRVVAGELGGRRLIAPPPGSAIRPTADRVREALFSVLGPIDGDRVCDLFCGTGALGIEALSRGAASAELVDRDTSLAEENVEALGIAARCRVVRCDTRSYLGRLGAFAAGQGMASAGFELVFCDPPWHAARSLLGGASEQLAALLAPGGRLVLESAASEPLELALPLADERRYGDALLRIHVP